MTPDRWEQINKLYYATLDVEEKDRPSFLDEACRQDPDLRSEVESLLNMRLTNDPGIIGYTSPTWSADGSRILFGGGTGKAGMGIYQMNSNGAGSKELLLQAEAPDQGILPTSWSPDGRFILYETSRDNVKVVGVLPLAGDRKPRLFVHNAFVGEFSPDGRWVAYSSAESGTPHG